MPPLLPTSPGEPRPRDSGSARHLVLPLVPGLGRPPTRRRPLPDAAAVRLVVVPDSAPPYDDERAATGHGAPREPRRLTLATGPQAVALTPQGDEPLGGDRQAAPQPPGQPATSGQPARKPARRGQAAAAAWPSQFAQVLAETLAGSRPRARLCRGPPPRRGGAFGSSGRCSRPEFSRGYAAS